MSTKNNMQISKNKAIHLDRRTCLACGACTAVCPVEALIILGLELTVNEELCISCGIAENVCPTGALSCPQMG